MNRDDRIPFNDDTPTGRDIDFEVSEDALKPQGPFNSPSEYEEHEPTKVLPSFEEPQPEPRYAQDAPTQRIGTAPGGQRPHTPIRNRPPVTSGNAEYTAPNHVAPQRSSGHHGHPAAQHGHPSAQYGHPEAAQPTSRRELTSAGWFRLLFGGLFLLLATWMLIHGSMSFIALQPAESLLNPFTLIGAPLLLLCLLLLPGPAGGKVVGILLAALSYGALILPGFLAYTTATSPITPFLMALTGPATVLFGFMTWLSVRGKRALAWVLIPLPPIIALVWALTAGAFGSMGVIFAGDWLLQLHTMGLAPWLDWMTVLPLDFIQSTLRFVTIGACVVPAVLLAWPFSRARLARQGLR